MRQPIRVQLDRRKYASDHHVQFFEYTTMTDERGRFAIEDVLPGEALVRREAPGFGAGRLYLASASPVDVVSGQTVIVDFGGQGRPIMGHSAVPAGTARKFDLAVGSGILLLDQPSMPLPDGFMTWDQARRYAISKKWSLSRGRDSDSPALVGCTCFRSMPTALSESTTSCRVRTSSRSISVTHPDWRVDPLEAISRAVSTPA